MAARYFKRDRFLQEYQRSKDIIQSIEYAGWKNPKVMAVKLSKDPAVQECVRRGISYSQYAKERHAKMKKKKAAWDPSMAKVELFDGEILDAHQRQVFWSNIVRDKNESSVNRLRASELLAKAQSDFGKNSGGKVPDEDEDSPEVEGIIKGVVTNGTKAN